MQRFKGKNWISLIILTGLFVALVALPRAEAQYKIDKSGSSVTVAGTSTLHDWESVAEDMSGSAEMTLEGNAITEISKLDFVVPVKSIKSGKGGMDKKIYEALKESNNPNIRYTLVSANINGTNISSTGDLTIAGKKRRVQMQVKYQATNSGVKFSGSTDIKMTEYEMEPPTAMMGTIKTGDDVTVTFSTTYKK